MATLDPDQLRALRVLRYWFAEDQVEVLGVVNSHPSHRRRPSRAHCSSTTRRWPRRLAPTTGIMGHVPQVDPNQLAAPRRLRVTFGPIEVLEVVDHVADVPEAPQGYLSNQHCQESGPGRTRRAAASARSTRPSGRRRVYMHLGAR